MEDDIDDNTEASESNIKPVDPLQVLEVFPADLRIQCRCSIVAANERLDSDCPGQLNIEVNYTFSLKNIVDQSVAFKVKTTAPRRYMVRPAQGTIPAGDTVAITIVLVKMSQFPDQSNPRNVRDKFLVQSFALPNEMSSEELNVLWVAKEKQHNPRANVRAYYEHRLKCRLLIPSEESQGSVVSVPPSPSMTDSTFAASEGPDQALGIVVSPPTEGDIALASQPMKTPLSLSSNAPANDIPPPAVPVDSVNPPKRKLDSDSDRGTSTQQDTTSVTDNQQKTTAVPARSKTLDAPILTNLPKEYDKMLAYSVKLTVDREALENKLAKLTEHNTFLLHDNERLREALAMEQTASVTGASAPDDKPRTVLESIQNDAQYQPLFDQDFDFSENHANLVASQLLASSGIQLWQVLAVATLCFVIGRVL